MHLPDDNYYQVNLIFSGLAQPRGAQVTWGFSRDTGTEVTLEGIADLFEAAWVARLRPLCSSQVSLAGIRVKQGPNDTGAFALKSYNIAGTAAYENHAAQAAVLVRKGTGYGGRHQSGRNFWPGATENDTTDGANLGAVGLGVYQTAHSQFLADLGALSGMRPVLLHSTAGPAIHPVTAVTVQSLFASQRRRIRKVGGRRRTTP